MTLDPLPLDPAAVVWRMNESTLLNVDSATAKPRARVNAPPAEHDDQQQRDSDNEPSAHRMSLHANRARDSEFRITHVTTNCCSFGWRSGKPFFGRRRALRPFECDAF